MVDVAMILEGTYPYVSGGVSSWVHAIITAMPDLSFGLLYLSPSMKAKREYKFKLPSNVTDFVEIYIYETVLGARERSAPSLEAWRAIDSAHVTMAGGGWPNFDPLLSTVMARNGRPRALGTEELARSRESWDILVRLYQQTAAETSFLDYFWTWRYSHYPIFQILQAEIIPARVYHAISTGWAGLLATLAKKRTGRPLVLTEHGIYTNERRIEIAQAEWIYEEERHDLFLKPEAGPLKQLWMRLFEGLGRITYDNADEIYTLYGGNKRMEVAFGAPADRIGIIPNGVKIETYPPREQRHPDQPFVIGFVGRVVPIKDVKTLLMACRQVLDRVPNTEVYIIGPTEEDQQYYEECLTLTSLLGMEGKIRYTGRANVREYYPKLDVLVMTSVSEGQPLVILEAWCAEVPIVATDVGACSEMILGGDEEDKALGAAGFVTQVGSPQETARALIALAENPTMAREMGRVGLARLKKYYDFKDMIERYRAIYRRNIDREG